MNFIAATIELKQHLPEPIEAYGLTFKAADGVIPHAKEDNQVNFRVLCYDKSSKLETFGGWAPGKRVLITGQLMFPDTVGDPFDLIVNTIEPNTPADMYVNQVVLSDSFFTKEGPKKQNNGSLKVSIGCKNDNSDSATFLALEAPEQLHKKLSERHRGSRKLSVVGQLREWDTGKKAYRAIVATNFSNPADYDKNKAKAQTGSAGGYDSIDPVPDY